MKRLITTASLVLLALGFFGCQSAAQRAETYQENFQAGFALTQAGQHSAAIPFYRKAIRALPHAPGSADAYNNLGWSLQSLGKLLDAIKAYEKALELRPDYSLAQNNLQSAQTQLAQAKAAMPPTKVQDKPE